MSEKVNASPAAQKLARANQLDLGEIKGSGNGGQVTKPDVEKAIEAAKAPASGDGAQEAAQKAAAAEEAGQTPPDVAAAEPAGPPAETERKAPEPEPPLPVGADAPPKPPPVHEVVAEETAGETLPIIKLTDNLGVTWWCPHCDFSQPGEHFTCGGCGAKRNGGPTAKLGDEVAAA